MTDHIKEAESCLRLAEDARLEDAMYLIGRAQVHATLALAEAQSSTLPVPLRGAIQGEFSEGVTFTYGVELSKHGTPYEVAITLKGRRIASPEQAKQAAEWYEQWTDGVTARPVYRRRLSAFSQWEAIDENQG